MNSLLIKNPRQKRAVEALLESAIAVKDMGAKIGALNPRQIIYELRRQGFEGIIKTRRFTIIDQDGKRCHPGEYYITQPSKPMTEKALREYNARAHSECFKGAKTHNIADYSRRK